MSCSAMATLKLELHLHMHSSSEQRPSLSRSSLLATNPFSSLQFHSNRLHNGSTTHFSLDHASRSDEDASPLSMLHNLRLFRNAIAYQAPGLPPRRRKKRPPDVGAPEGRLESSPAVEKLTGALSRYLRPETRRRVRLLNPQERRAAVESVLTAENLLSTLDGFRFKLEPSDFNAILRRFGELEKWRQVSLVFDWMKVNKKLIPSTVTSFISLMEKAGLAEKALRSYRGLTDLDMRQNKFICNALFRTLINSGHADKAFILFDEVKVDGFTPDLYTYSALIAGCESHLGGYSKAESLLKEILAMGLKPDSFVYASLLDVCANFHLEGEAKGLFERMKTDTVSPNIFHYSSLLNIFAEKGKADEAEKVFRQMEVAGLPLNQVILNSLIKAYFNSGQLEKAVKVFNKMASLGFPPEDVSYCLLLEFYCKEGKLEEADMLFKEMKEKGISSGINGYCILISAYSKLGKVEKVEALTKEVQSREQGVSDLVLFNTLLKSYCDLGMMDTVMTILKRMEEESAAPDLATFNILISYFCKERLLDLAHRTLDDLKARKLLADLDSYAPLLTRLSELGKVDQAMDLFAEMKEANIVLSSFVFDSLIEALCKERRADEALSFFTEMLKLKFSPLESCVEHLLILAGSRMDILEEIIKSSTGPLVNLKQVDFASVLSSYQEQGYDDAVVKVLNYLKEHDYVASIEVLNRFVNSLEAVDQTKTVTSLL